MKKGFSPLIPLPTSFHKAEGFQGQLNYQTVDKKHATSSVGM